MSILSYHILLFVLNILRFPVEIMVLNVTSEKESVVRKMNANTLLDSAGSGESYVSSMGKLVIFKSTVHFY